VAPFNSAHPVQKNHDTSTQLPLQQVTKLPLEKVNVDNDDDDKLKPIISNNHWHAMRELMLVLSAGKRFQTFSSLSLKNNDLMMKCSCRPYNLYTVHDFLWNLNAGRNNSLFAYIQVQLTLSCNSKSSGNAILNFASRKLQTFIRGKKHQHFVFFFSWIALGNKG